MHEMSIAVGLIELAEDQARAAGAGHINSLEVEIGVLAGVEFGSLAFCYESARLGTLCEGARLDIIERPGRGHCPVCRTDTDVDFFVALCPDCDGGLEIRQGRELRLRSLNVD